MFRRRKAPHDRCSLKRGKHLRWADTFPIDIPAEGALFQAVKSLIDWFAAIGRHGERFVATIGRVGSDQQAEHLPNRISSH